MLQTTGKMIELKPQKRLFLPVIWRNKFNWCAGNSLSLRWQENDKITIQKEKRETDITCVIGENGSICIPKEIIYVLGSKNINLLELFVNDPSQQLVLVPMKTK